MTVNKEINTIKVEYFDKDCRTNEVLQFDKEINTSKIQHQEV
jgi:hypothetical protein